MDKIRIQIIEDILARSIDRIVDQDRLKKRLLAGEKLRVKFGIDPTSPFVHIGRAVPILKLKKFQELGCKIILIIGDFTGVIGDTSDKESERPMLGKDIIEKNLKTYIEQFKKLVDVDKAEIRYNSEWLSKLGYWELCEQAELFSLNDFSARSNIKKRLDSGRRVSLRELFYPLMQGYDSVIVKADVEVGGSDQWFNLLSGRVLQKYYGQEPQDIMTNVLIEGTDGRKMSSSWGNTINLLDEPKEMYGKVMSIDDNLIIKYFMHCTEVPLDQIREYEELLKNKNTNPRDIKAVLAFQITKLYWGKNGAQDGQNYFDSVIRKKEIPPDIKEIKVVSGNIVAVLVDSGLVKSKSEARRVMESSGLKINGKIVKNLDFKPESGSVIQKGKRGFVKIVLK